MDRSQRINSWIVERRYQIECSNTPLSGLFSKKVYPNKTRELLDKIKNRKK